MKKRRVVVLDTNCLVQSISQRSNYYPVWKSFIAGEYDLCVSSEILEEYEEVIGGLMSPLAAKIVVEAILKAPNTRRLDPHFRFRLIEKDPDDNKFVDCALGRSRLHCKRRYTFSSIGIYSFSYSLCYSIG